MGQRFKTRASQKTVQRTLQNASAKVRQANKRIGNINDNVEEEERLGEEAPDVDMEDSCDWEDDEYREDYGQETETIFSESDAEPVSGTRAIWLWCAGRIVWSAEIYGFNLAERENMRRKMNDIISFLRKKLSMEVTPLILEEFFLQENLCLPEISANEKNSESESGLEEKTEKRRNDTKKKKIGSWLSHLDTVGIMIDGDVYPLDCFIMKQGGTSATMPRALEFAWLTKSMERHMSYTLGWKAVKEWLPLEINEFCIELNSVAGTEFNYIESTLQRKKLPIWKEWFKGAE